MLWVLVCVLTSFLISFEGCVYYAKFHVRRVFHLILRGKCDCAFIVIRKSSENCCDKVEILVFSLWSCQRIRWRKNKSWRPWRVLKIYRMIGIRYVRIVLTVGHALVSLYFLFISTVIANFQELWIQNIKKINIK